MPEDISQSMENWKSTRHGAWAGRGFHYQHLVSTLILLRQWTGLIPTGALVPEGLEDCVVERADKDHWLQIKSRKDGTFSEAEANEVKGAVKKKAEKSHSKKVVSVALVLEQNCPGNEAGTLDAIFEDDASDIAVCQNPEIEIMELLIRSLVTADVIAEGIASDVYKLVADASAQNASLSFENRRRITSTEVEQRITRRLEAEDPSAIDKAITSGALQPVDFTTAVDEPSFYLGVKAKPGHIAAGLILGRDDDVQSVVTSLKSKRHVLISAPSGTGKSALMWLSAYHLMADARWFQVSSYASATQADDIFRFVRSRKPGKTSPIALALDDITSANSDLWDILVRELRAYPDVYLLGSIRREDEQLIVNKADTETISIQLGEKLAENIWAKLKRDGHTQRSHWRESFEESKGLLLEYVHILTQGKRLSEVIEDQVRLRETENRVDELAILRGTSAICARDGEVDVAILFKAIGLNRDNGALALKRLIDEHLVRESRPGILGGLHALRSEALNSAVHDDVAHIQMNSVWTCLMSATPETLPRVVRSVLAEAEEGEHHSILSKLAEKVSRNQQIEHWIAVFTGLGLATLELQVAAFIRMLVEFDVQVAHWPLLSMFYDPETTVPEVPELEHWERMRDAVRTFREQTMPDLRIELAKMLPEGSSPPACQSLQEANRLLSSLVPIGSGVPV